MELKDALAAARHGKAVAFLGAGFSLFAKTSDGGDIPTTAQLATRLCKEIDEEDLAFDAAATVFKMRNPQNPHALATFLERQFTVSDVGEPHLEFCKTPWRRIYTTNYDNIVEVASRKVGIPRLSLSSVAHPEEQDKSLPWIVHLHGSVSELARSGKQAQLIIDKESYLRLEVMKTAWPTRLQADLAMADAVFFIGFSFDDLHLVRLFRESPVLKRKTFIVIKPNASKGLVDAAKLYGEVFDIGTDGFVKKLRDVDIGDAYDICDQQNISFTEFILPNTSIKADSNHIFRLLVGGHFDPAVYLQSLIEPSIPYSLKRNYAMRQLANDSSGARKYLVVSRIGNGKSIFFREMAVHFAKDGYKVLFGGHETRSLLDELERLRRDRKPLAIMYESIREFEGAIKKVSTELQARDVLLVASRPTAFAADFQNLRNVIGEGFGRLDLDSLPQSDIA
jgi:hypothetical protein